MTAVNSKIPPFYVTRTLLGFGPGPDLNRVSLQFPNGHSFILCEMNEPRTDTYVKRWNKLAGELSDLWNTKSGSE